MTTGSIGVIAAAVFSVLAAFTLLPAPASPLAGENINRWPIGDDPSALRAGAAGQPHHRPPAAGLGARADPAARCSAAARSPADRRPGPEDVQATTTPMRRTCEAVADAYGGGVMAPYQVVVTSAEQPVTSPSDIRELEQFQTKVRRRPGGQVRDRPGHLPRAQRLRHAPRTRPTELANLDFGLSAPLRPAREKLREGSTSGSDGAAQLAAANNAALAGAEQLQSASRQAPAGAGSIDTGLEQVRQRIADNSTRRWPSCSSGASQLRSATRSAKSQARSIVNGSSFCRTNSPARTIRSPRPGSRHPGRGLQPRLGKGLARLAARRRSRASRRSRAPTPRSATRRARVNARVRARNDTLLSKYRAIAGALDSGVSPGAQRDRQTRRGSRRPSANSPVASSRSRASTGEPQLGPPAALAAAAASSTRDSLRSQAARRRWPTDSGRLGAGSSALSDGLASGETRARASSSKGLGKLESTVDDVSGDEDAELDLEEVGKSPYLTMALLSAAPEEQKRNLNFVLNEENGGSSSRIYPLHRAATRPTRRSRRSTTRLVDQTDELAKTARRDGGGRRPGPHVPRLRQLHPLAHLAADAALSLMSFLFLLVVFRSVLLAAKAVCST